MHVLVTEAHFGDSGRLVQRLRGLGVRVTGCHDRVGYCRVLRPGGRCPLDDVADTVDFVVDVRGAGQELTAREYGAVCSVRAGRPIWIVAPAPDLPAEVPPAMRDFGVIISEDDLLTMCQRLDRSAAAARLATRR